MDQVSSWGIWDIKLSFVSEDELEWHQELIKSIKDIDKVEFFKN